LSLDEIADRLELPKTTIYYWIRDLPLGRARSENGWPDSARRKGSKAMQAKYRRLREEAYAQGLAEYDELFQLPTFRDFVVLYIAEGYKRRRHTVSICNSDPAILVIAATWLSRVGTKPLVEQRTVERPHLALGTWGDDDHGQRHLPPSPSAGVDRPGSRWMAARLGKPRRGVAKPGYRAAFGRRRPPVRIRAPRFQRPDRAGSKPQ
jgi:AcrR family transcriptional regulator